MDVMPFDIKAGSQAYFARGHVLREKFIESVREYEQEEMGADEQDFTFRPEDVEHVHIRPANIGEAVEGKTWAICDPGEAEAFPATVLRPKD